MKEKLIDILLSHEKSTIFWGTEIAKGLDIDMYSLFNIEWLEKYGFISQGASIKKHLSFLRKTTTLNFQKDNCSFESFEKIPPFRSLENMYMNHTFLPNAEEICKTLQTIYNFNTLKHITLQYNYITDLFPEVGKLRQLKRLNLEGNNLEELPNEFCELKNLEWLNISSNLLQKLPNDFGLLQNLRYLNITRNNLKELPSSFEKLQKLEILRIGQNELIELPKKIGKLTQLKELNIYSNRVTTIPSEIGKLQNLNYLNICRNSIKTLPLEIKNLTQLKRFRINYFNKIILPTIFGKFVDDF